MIIDPADLGIYICAPGAPHGIEVDILGAELRTGSVVILNRETYVAALSFGRCLVNGCNCVRSMTIRLLPPGHPGAIQAVRTRLVDSLTRMMESKS